MPMARHLPWGNMPTPHLPWGLAIARWRGASACSASQAALFPAAVGRRWSRYQVAQLARGFCSEACVSVSAARLEQLLEAEITTLSMREGQSLTLQSILDLASTTDQGELARLLHEELPVRFAQRIKMLEALPRWHDTVSFASVRQMYMKSFKELRLADPGNPRDFQRQLRRIEKRHSQTNLLVNGFKHYAEADQLMVGDINEWLDHFFTLRVSTHMLMTRYMHRGGRVLIGKSLSSMGVPDNVYGEEGGCDPYRISIDSQCSVGRIAQHAAQLVGRMCILRYGVVPRVTVTDRAAKSFSFVPRYLFYILSELLKNSVRATVEAHPGAKENELPDISILISGDEESCCVRVSDEGGGVPTKELSKIWSYFYTTAEPIENTVSRVAVDMPEDLRWLLQAEAEAEAEPLDKDLSEAPLLQSPLAGLGCGLPLCRLYTKYLGGSLELQSMPKYGTDVFVYLNRLESSGTAPSR